MIVGRLFIHLELFKTSFILFTPRFFLNSAITFEDCTVKFTHHK